MKNNINQELGISSHINILVISNTQRTIHKLKHSRLKAESFVIRPELFKPLQIKKKRGHGGWNCIYSGLCTH